MNAEINNMSQEQINRLILAFPGVLEHTNGDSEDEISYAVLLQKAAKLEKSRPRLTRLDFFLKSAKYRDYVRNTEEWNACTIERLSLQKKMDAGEPAPLQWKLLATTDSVELAIVQKPGQYALLTTKKAVALQRFDGESNDWENSELRAWLNGEFFALFTEEQREMIVRTERKDFSSAWLPKNTVAWAHSPNDRDYLGGFEGIMDYVSLFNPNEVRALLPNQEDRILKFKYQAVDWWTLRPLTTYKIGSSGNPGIHEDSKRNRQVVCIDATGSFLTEFIGYVTNAYAVRPLIVIDLSASRKESAREQTDSLK